MAVPPVVKSVVVTAMPLVVVSPLTLADVVTVAMLVVA